MDFSVPQWLACHYFPHRQRLTFHSPPSSHAQRSRSRRQNSRGQKQRYGGAKAHAGEALSAKSVQLISCIKAAEIHHPHGQKIREPVVYRIEINLVENHKHEKKNRYNRPACQKALEKNGDKQRKADHKD